MQSHTPTHIYTPPPLSEITYGGSHHNQFLTLMRHARILSGLGLVTNVAVFVSSICSSSPTLPCMAVGGGDVLDRRAGRSSRCTGPPKRVVQPRPLYHTLPSGTAGQQERRRGYAHRPNPL